MKMISRFLLLAALTSGAAEREVYLNQFPAGTATPALTEYVRVFDTGDGSLLLRWHNPTGAPVSRGISQELGSPAPRSVQLRFEVLHRTGTPQLALRYGNISNSAYLMPIPLESGVQVVTLDPETAQLCDGGWGVPGPHPAGSDILGWGLEFSGPAGSALELKLYDATVTDRDGGVKRLFDPYAPRDSYSALADYEPNAPWRGADQPRVYVALSSCQLWQPYFKDTLVKLRERFGDALGIHLSYPLFPRLAATVRELNVHGIKTTMEGHQGAGFYDYLTNHGLYLTRSDGFTMSDPAQWERTAGRFPWPHHGLDYTAGDAAMIGLKHMLDRAARIGLTEYLDIDFIWPWNGRHGYGANQIAAFRRNLLGEDDGFDYEVAPGEFQRLKFHDYLRLFTDIEITAAMTGSADWHSYSPVTEAQASNGGIIEQCNLFVFIALTHYECLKFMGQVAHYAAGVGVDYIPGSNPEDINNGNDIYHASRLRDVKKYGYEFFGSPFGTYAWYHNMRFYAGNLARFGKSIYLIGEINGGGHGPTRYEHQLAYAFYYDLTHAAKPSDCNIQYLENHVWDGRPATDDYNQGRWGHWAGGAFGFLRSHAERAALPAPRPLTVIASRSVLEYQDGMSAGVTQRNNPARFLDQLHYAFDLAGKEALTDGFLDDCDVVFYAPSQSSPMHLAAAVDWLEARPNRTLITHSGVPFAIFDGGVNLARGIQEVAWEAGKSYSRFSTGGARSELPSFVSAAAALSPRSLTLTGDDGRTLTAERDYQTLTEGVVLLSDDHGVPLISELKRGTGRILYLHAALPFSDDGEFNRAVLERAMRLAGMRPEATGSPDWSIHRYEIDGGNCAVLWHSPTLQSQGENNFYSRVPVAAPAVFVTVPPGDYLRYDFFNDRLEPVQVGADGQLALPVTASCDIFYFGPADSAAFQAVLDAARAQSAEVGRLDYQRYLTELKSGARRLHGSDFETGGDAPTGWNTWYDSAYIDDPSGQLVRSGRRSLALYRPTTPDQRWVTTGIPVIPGQLYWLRGQLKLDGADADDLAQLRVEQLNADQQFVAAIYGPGVSEADQGAWREVELLFRPAPGITSINLLAVVSCGANAVSGPDCAAYFDDIELSELPE